MSSSTPGALAASPTTVDFGNVSVGNSGNQAVSISNPGSSPVQISQLITSNPSFTVDEALPVTIPAGSTIALKVHYSPTTVTDSTAQLSVVTDRASSSTMVKLHGKGTQGTATLATLSVSTISLSFGNVSLKTAVTKSVTLTSTGTAPVKINTGTVTGTGFSVTGATFPATLNPGQAVVLTVQFAPTAAGSVAGQLTISSNSSSNSTAAVSLSGTGTSASPSVSAVYCNSASMTGSATDACSVTLTGSAPSGGVTVSLLSNNQAVAIPASVTVPAAATSAGFTANVSAVTTAQSATITASAGGASMGFALQLNPTVPTLSINATSVSFGSVVISASTTQVLTLSSTGTSPVTVKGASVTGAGFSISGATLPVTLNPGQSTSLTLQFAPTAVGSASGQLTITSNSSSNPTAVLSLSGTGASHEVDLSWSAPTGSSDPAVGFNVYRAPTGTTSYQLTGQVSQTVFADTTVQSGQTYDYIVKSVDSANVESGPSNTTTIAIP